jgi:hypothetical protein
MASLEPVERKGLMFCPKCGQQNDDSAYKCVKCGQVLQQTAPAGMPTGAIPSGTVPNYLVQSILVTLCCCPAFGIVSIVFAAQVNGRLATGDMAGALDYSGKAKLWAWIAFGLGLLTNGAGFVIGIINAIVASHQ